MKSVPSVHKFKSRKEWEKYVWKKLVEGFAKTASAQGIERSLDMLLTTHEKEQMIKRAAAISLLKQGKTYREIGEMLWLSPQTISAIRKSMRAGEVYTSRYMRQKRGEKTKKPLHKETQLEFKLLFKAIFTLPPPPPSSSRRIPPGKEVTQPHGKLAFPQRRKR